MFGLSGGEILVIALIALILFGNEKLPEHMRQLFRGVMTAKKTAHDLQRSWYETRQDIEKHLALDEEQKTLKELGAVIAAPITLPIVEETVPQAEIDDARNSAASEAIATDLNITKDPSAPSQSPGQSTL